MVTRRQFLQASASLMLMPALMRTAGGVSILRSRPSWSKFRIGPSYQSFLSAVGAMRANTDSTSPASWAYWVNVHMSTCPHGKPYFLAWHRGFLARFEGHLRKVSGDSSLVLPYWNYYSDPILPPEFSDPALPLYRGDRTGSDVTAALSLAAFDDSITNFQRGKSDAFEPAVETAPHNGVHNLIGGSMANITVSPRDPIFWLHHANIDRLWDAWVYAGNGRHMPATTNSYWSGSFSYGPAVQGLPRVATYATSNLGYTYDHRTLPSTLPATLQAMGAQPLQAEIKPIVAQPLPPHGVSLGGVAGLALGRESIRVQMPLAAPQRDRVRALLNRPGSLGADSNSRLRVVLDGVSVTEEGARGGYFYKVLLNLPPRGMARGDRTYLIGTLGPFEVGVAIHARRMTGAHMAMDANARLILPALDALRRIWPAALDELTLSFVRVGIPGNGAAIQIERLWMEADD